MKIGLVINPLAGIGGSVALKGSDGDDIVRLAMERGAVPLAQKRTHDALQRLGKAADIQMLTINDGMGEDVLRSLDMPGEVIYEVDMASVDHTTAEDTRAAVTAFAEAGVDLIVFAGGDGTARDVYTALKAIHKDESIPVIGIPAGCKIHSAVYATSPAMAGELLREIVDGKPVSIKQSEVMDLDEDEFRQGRVKASCFGYLPVPVDDLRMQVIKQGGIDYDAIALQDIAAGLVERMEENVLYLVGTGSTTAAIMDELGLENTLLGVDAVMNHELIASDVGEPEIMHLLDEAEAEGRGAKIIVSIIGGQGNIFGRGNQQFSSRVIDRVGVDNIIVIATNEKLRALEDRPLRVDTGDEGTDARLRGTIHVLSGYDQRTLMQVR